LAWAFFHPEPDWRLTVAKKKAAPVNETTSVYICNVTVRHNGDRFYKGEQIDLLPSEAVHLLAAGSISPKLVPAAAPQDVTE